MEPVNNDLWIHAGPFFFFKISLIYLTQREREHKQGERQAEGEGEAGSPLSRHGAPSQDTGTTTPAKGRHSTN